MPDEPQGFLEKRNLEGEASPVSLMPGIMVICGDGKGKITDRNVLELDEFNQNTDANRSQSSGDNISQSGLRESQVSIEVGVAKTVQVPEPLQVNSLLKGTGGTLQALDQDTPVKSSSDDLHPVSSCTSTQLNGCCDFANSSTESRPGDICTNLNPDLCDEKLSELDRRSFEKTNTVSPVNFSETSLEASSKRSKSSQDNDKTDTSETDLKLSPKVENTFSDSSSTPPEALGKVQQTRDSIAASWDEEDRQEDGRSTHSRRTVREGMCCCYQAFHRAFLQCVEETPAMLSGLVLSLAFCVAIIILIPTTGRVRRGKRECACVCGYADVFEPDITSKF